MAEKKRERKTMKELRGDYRERERENGRMRERKK